MNKFKITNTCCRLSIVTQALITNLTAVLYIPLKNLYGLTYTQFGILIGVNFVAQFLADISFSGVIDKVGYRKIVLPTCVLSCVGLIMLSLSPFIFPKSLIFIGLLIATVIFAFSSGLLEIILSPIVAGIATENKGSAMSAMHSFYAWGQAITIAITTLFLFFVGSKYWQIIVFMWAFLPLLTFFLFLKAPFPPLVEAEKRQTPKQILFKPFYLLCILAIFFGGASEIIINQWSSIFMENALKLPKVLGDLLGMCGFSIMLGLGRSMHGKFGSKINLNKLLIWTSLLSFVCYVTIGLSPSDIVCVIACAICGFGVSLLWPGTIVLASEKFPLAGAWLFAILAMAGDFSGAIMPTLTGMIIDGSVTSGIVAGLSGLLNITLEQGALRLGMLTAAICPLLCFVCHLFINRLHKKDLKMEVLIKE